jgi:hypothetical protein
MKHFVVAAFALVAMSLPVFADTPLTDEETKSATAAASALGCEGGKWEKETEGTGVYELDDAKCKGGNYDLKFDKNFKLILMDAD